MRGGVFARTTTSRAADLARLPLDPQSAGGRAARHRSSTRCPATIPATDLRPRRPGDGRSGPRSGSCHEYLPLYFGRRHGDPSRPWNRFAIQRPAPGRQPGAPLRGQLARHLPELGGAEPELPRIPARHHRQVRQRLDRGRLQSVPHRRATASTGRWSTRTIPGATSATGAITRSSTCSGSSRRSSASLRERSPDCSNTRSSATRTCRTASSPTPRSLPIRARPSITTADLAARIDERVRAIGTDGKLVVGPDGACPARQPAREAAGPRALQALESRSGCGGIWMNTQRPEWNDANNALVGNGVSMVTLCHLRRYLHFLDTLLANAGGRTIPISSEVGAWLRRLAAILEERSGLLIHPAIPDQDRKRVLDELGESVLLVSRDRLSRRALRPGGVAGERDRRALPARAGLARPRDPREPARGRPLPRLQPDRARPRTGSPFIAGRDAGRTGRGAELGRGWCR